jgi:hypothetical protein
LLTRPGKKVRTWINGLIGFPDFFEMGCFHNNSKSVVKKIEVAINPSFVGNTREKSLIPNLILHQKQFLKKLFLNYEQAK